MEIELFETGNERAWDEAVANMKISSPAYTWAMLNFFSLAANAENKSFILKNDAGQRIAVCPLLVETCRDEKRAFRSVSARGGPIAAPVIVRMGDENRTRRDLRLMEEVLQEKYRELEVAKISYVHRAYSLMHKDAVCFETSALFDLLSLGYIPSVFQSVTVDLRLPEETLLAELSKYHRREITRAKSAGQQVKVFDAAAAPADAENMFREFQEVYTKAAGGKASPQACFDAMRRMLADDKGALFVNVYNGTPISYLYCAHSGGIAVGWMQVNAAVSPVDAPRHLTEWEAILYYRRNGRFLYEVGTRFLKSQFDIVVDDKLESIGFYKERFGGVLAPEIRYTKYLDRDLMEAEWQDKLRHGIDAHIGQQ